MDSSGSVQLRRVLSDLFRFNRYIMYCIIYIHSYCPVWTTKCRVDPAHLIKQMYSDKITVWCTVPFCRLNSVQYILYNNYFTTYYTTIQLYNLFYQPKSQRCNSEFSVQCNQKCKLSCKNLSVFCQLLLLD